MKKYYKLFVRPHLKGIFIGIIAIATSAFISAIAPVISGKITTQLATDSINILNSVDGASVNFSYILNIIKILGMLYVAAALLTYSSTWILTNEMQNMMNEVRCEVSRKIHNLPVSYFDAHPLGDVLSRVSNDIEVLAVALFQSFSQMITTVLTVVLCAIIMIKINLLLAFVALMIIPCSLIISKVLVKLSQKHFNEQQSMLGKLNGCTQEMFTNFTEIKLYGKQDDAIEEFKTINEELKKSGHHAQFVSSIMNPLIALSTYLIIIIVAILGAFNILAGSLSIGNLQAFIRYIWQVYEPISTVSQLSSSIQSAISAAKRVYEFLEEEEELETIKDPNMSFNPTNISSIKFDHVKFAYNESNPLISDLSFDVKEGQMVAIVGPTGGGKTTLINLLMRFYRVNSGSILINGTNINDISSNDLHALFGMVLQDTWLFNGTIMDNIRYGNPNASDYDVYAAAKAANVDHFIHTLQDEYKLVLDEESNNISIGEKQLLTIARALLANPKILILDEATSSIDTRLESLIQNAMHSLLHERTSFVIAHRLSTIRSADLILVVNNGDIIESGTHESLIADKGFYANLYNSQFEVN